MSSTIKDFITAFSGQDGTPQTITTDAVSEDIIQFASSPQQIGLKGMLVEFVVGTAWSGADSGCSFELRADTAASLASGSQVLCGTSGIVPVADLTAGARIEVHVRPRLLASTFVYFGAFYNLASEAASGGSTIFASTKQGGLTDVIS